MRWSGGAIQMPYGDGGRKTPRFVGGKVLSPSQCRMPVFTGPRDLLVAIADALGTRAAETAQGTLAASAACQTLDRCAL